jgi:hypothetical protein
VKHRLVFFLLLAHLVAGGQTVTSPGAEAKDTSNRVLTDEWSSASKTSHPKRKLLAVSGVHLVGYATTLALLSEAWYEEDEKTSFHTFDDSKEWLQVDKVGHAWTTYNIARNSAASWSWSGLPHNKAVLLGGLSSIGFQTILEYLDGHSRSWGWSWSDMGANTLGAALYVSQELAWKKQLVHLKFSAHTVQHGDLKGRAQPLFGPSLPERLLKDYNGQTYWLSFNSNVIAPSNKKWSWMSMAVGYGAKGLYGGFENVAHDGQGMVTFDRRDIKRVRQWYLSPDIDFTKIPTRRRGVRTLLSLLNMVKFPAPALELSGGKIKGHLLYF